MNVVPAMDGLVFPDSGIGTLPQSLNTDFSLGTDPSQERRHLTNLIFFFYLNRRSGNVVLSRKTTTNPLNKPPYEESGCEPLIHWPPCSLALYTGLEPHIEKCKCQ